jgi:hypothetical protein
MRPQTTCLTLIAALLVYHLSKNRTHFEWKPVLGPPHTMTFLNIILPEFGCSRKSIIAYYVTARHDINRHKRQITWKPQSISANPTSECSTVCLIDLSDNNNECITTKSFLLYDNNVSNWENLGKAAAAAFRLALRRVYCRQREPTDSFIWGKQCGYLPPQTTPDTRGKIHVFPVTGKKALDSHCCLYQWAQPVTHDTSKADRM